MFSRPRWTGEMLDRFIADPEAVAPKTTMAFAGYAMPTSGRPSSTI